MQNEFLGAIWIANFFNCTDICRHLYNQLGDETECDYTRSVIKYKYKIRHIHSNNKKSSE